mgnify:CR=1 FL=1
MKNVLIMVFNVLLVLCIIPLIEWSNIKLLIFTLIYIMLNVFIYGIINKIKIRRYMFILLFITILILQIITAEKFKVIPTWDFGIVFDEAIITSIKIKNIDYFCTYPNNIPIMYILKIIFKFSTFVNIKNKIDVGIITNIIAIDISIIILVLIIKEIKNKKTAFFSLLLVFMTPVIYLAVPIFYTDTLSMPFPIMLIYFYIKFKREGNVNKKVIYSILLGLVTVLGINIKITVGITFIAIIIYELVAYKEKSKIEILYILLSIITILVLIFFEMIFFRFKFMDVEKLKNDRLPVTHFIMMSLGNNGGYSGNDVKFTKSFSNEREKVEANIAELKIRWQKYNRLDKLYEYVKKRNKKIWNDGTYYMPVLLNMSQVKSGKVQDFIYKDNDFYVLISQIQRQMFFILTICVIVNYKKSKDNNINIILEASIFGLVIFFSFWEVNSRYLINYVPIFNLIEINGIEILYIFIMKFYNKNFLKFLHNTCQIKKSMLR